MQELVVNLKYFELKTCMDPLFFRSFFSIDRFHSFRASAVAASFVVVADIASVYTKQGKKVESSYCDITFQ